MNIQRIITVKRYGVIIVGLEFVTRRPSPYRNGHDNWIKVILPQHMPEEGAVPRSIGRFWFKSGKSMGAPK